MKQLRWYFIIAIFFCACIPIRVYANTIEDMPFYSKNMIVWNLEADTIVYERNAAIRTAPASLAKLVTALVVMDYIESKQLSDTITITQQMLDGLASRSATVNGLRVSDQITISDALKGMLIGSGADSSNALAYYLEEQTHRSFLSLVNQKIEQLQLSDTKLKNAHGLDEEGQYTTAFDMALVMKEFLRNPLLVQIQSTYQDQMAVSGKNSRVIPLRGTLLPMNVQSDIYQKEIVLGKTGITGDAGRCLNAYLNTDGMSFIVVMMQAPIPLVSYHHAPNLDLQKLIPILYNQYKLITYQTKQEFAQYLKVGASHAMLELMPAQDPVFFVKKENMLDNMEISVFLPDPIPLPIEVDQSVGTIQWKQNGAVIRTIDLVSSQAINAPFLQRTLSLLELILNKHWFIAVIGLLAYNQYINYKNAKRNMIVSRKIAFKGYYDFTKKVDDQKRKIPS